MNNEIINHGFSNEKMVEIFKERNEISINAIMMESVALHQLTNPNITTIDCSNTINNDNENYVIELNIKITKK